MNGIQMEKNTHSLETFKASLDQQGYVSPMLSTLTPLEKLRRSASQKEIFGYVLEGELELVTQEQHFAYAKHEIFFIDGSENFEIHSGAQGVEYLFAFKNKS
jgi:hypothetical protein